MKTFLKPLNGGLAALKPADFVSEFIVAADHVYIRFIQSGTRHCAGTCPGATEPRPKDCPTLTDKSCWQVKAAELAKKSNAMPGARAGQLGIARGLKFQGKV